MIKLKPTDKHSGFTLVEMAIATGLLALTVLASLQMSQTVRSSSRAGEAVSDYNSLVGVAREKLRYRSTCTAAIVGLNTTGFTNAALTSNKEISLLLPGIHMDSTPGNDLLAAGTPVRKINIQSVHLSDAVNLGGGKFFAQIQMEGVDRISGIALKAISLGSIYFSTAAGAIVSCDNADVDKVPLCVEMGCVWDVNLSPMCQCPQIDLNCPPQQFATGVDSVGQPICTPLGGVACPAGSYLRGVSIGASDCALLPGSVAPPPPPPPLLSVNGFCGLANGSSRVTAPSSAFDLCFIGSSTLVTGSGPWTWKCLGSGGGIDANCATN